MTPGASKPAREGSATRVSGALGVSVALHVLGAVALWRGVSSPEPEPLVPAGPVPVELVWREAARSGSPSPVSTPRGIARPASPGRVREARPQPEVRAPEPPPSPGVVPSESAPEAPGAEPVPGGAPVGDGESVALGPGGLPERGTDAAGASGGAPGGGGLGDSQLVAYREQLSRHVTRGLRYPSQAVRLRLEGTARVHVRINRDGSLAGPPRLEGSSRFRVLDLEALRVVEAAAPFSPLPPELSRESVEFVIPVSFSLRAASG